MYIIVGLGNPDRKYDNTRHNTGYVTIDRIADRYGIDIMERKFKSVIGKGVIDGERVVLVKPLTYMNLSGEAVREVADYFKVDPQTQVCIIYDDTSMEVGKIRIRKKGSAGGHNGIKSIIS
ncbi:MAG: aminoacyl-tRNA hydrolase, partial [Lachnospiraceae bacterium]|nr:aminoacyl-tRNA hydrolase [Lachnospiraceae bacterium]